MGGLFLPCDPVLGQNAGDGTEVTGDTQAFPQLGESSVRSVRNQLEQTSHGGGIEFRRRTTRVGRWLERTRAAIALQQTDHEGQADSEKVDKLAEGVFATFDGSKDPLPQVGRVRSHGCSSSAVTPRLF